MERNVEREMTACPLCKLEKKTHWYVSTDCYVICDCDICNVPMLVWREHIATQPTGKDFEYALGVLTGIANCKFGDGKWMFDFTRRKIPDHWHCHVRAKV
jgi:hypothetical protein